VAVDAVREHRNDRHLLIQVLQTLRDRTALGDSDVPRASETLTGAG
jgi:hypothetical protein